MMIADRQPSVSTHPRTTTKDTAGRRPRTTTPARRDRHRTGRSPAPGIHARPLRHAPGLPSSLPPTARPLHNPRREFGGSPGRGRRPHALPDCTARGGKGRGGEAPAARPAGTGTQAFPSDPAARHPPSETSAPAAVPAPRHPGNDSSRRHSTARHPLLVHRGPEVAGDHHRSRNPALGAIDHTARHTPHYTDHDT